MRKLYVLAFQLVGACAASGPPYADVAGQLLDVPSEDSRIVFFRTRESTLYIARKARIAVDGDVAGFTAYGGFHYLDLQPGEHVIRADTWDSPGLCEVAVRLAPGETYYLQVDPRQESFWAFSAGDTATSLLGSGVFSVIGGLGAATLESYGKECAGAFRLYPVDSETARARLADLKVSD